MLHVCRVTCHLAYPDRSLVRQNHKRKSDAIHYQGADIQRCLFSHDGSRSQCFTPDRQEVCDLANVEENPLTDL